METTVEELQRTKVDWQKTEESAYIFKTFLNGNEVRLRLNDFPEEPLCTLLVGTQEIDIEDFPKYWYFLGVEQKYRVWTNT